MRKAIKKAIETYNKITKIYADYTFHKLMQFQLNKFISMLPKKAKILDVGCGSGRDARYFKEFGLDVTAIDISDNMLEEAKKRAKGIKFEKMDMLNMSFENNSFDGVWIMATLSDITKEDSPKFLKDINRILKDNGVLYIAVKEGKGEKIIKKEKYNNLERFYCYYTQEELGNLLRETGFEIVNTIASEDKKTRWVEIFARNGLVGEK